jgi:RimJ/RimL family protein N-acetyltransferase
MAWCRRDYSLADARAFISKSKAAWETGERYSFVITDPGDTLFLGSAGLSQVCPVHRIANVGYWVRSSCAGRGVGTAATRLIADFGLNQLQLNRLEMLVAAENFASQRVAQKAGARFEGLLRDRLVLDGRRHDAVLYSLVEADLRAERTP